MLKQNQDRIRHEYTILLKKNIAAASHLPHLIEGIVPQIHRHQSRQIAKRRIVHVRQCATLHIELLQFGQIQERVLRIQLYRIVGQRQRLQIGSAGERIRIDGRDAIRAKVRQHQVLGRTEIVRRYAGQLVVVEVQTTQLGGRRKGAGMNVINVIVTEIELNDAGGQSGNCAELQMRAVDELRGVCVVAMATRRAGGLRCIRFVGGCVQIVRGRSGSKVEQWWQCCFIIAFVAVVSGVGELDVGFVVR